MSDKFSPLRSAFETAPDTSTIRGIVKYLKLWLEEADNAPPDLLEKGCWEMSGRLEAARLATERELNATGPATQEELEDPVLRSIEAYQHLKEITFEIAEAVAEEKRTEARELLRELEEAAEYLRDAQHDLQSWVENPVMRCPRCGAEDNDPCPVCGLELLYLDPKGGAGLSSKTAQLPPEFGRVYEAYMAVRDGKLSLSAIWETLPALEKSVRAQLSMVNGSLMEKPESSPLLQTLQALGSLTEGIELMRSTHSTRRMTDLQEGWQIVFQNAVEIQELRLRLLEELGGEAGQEQAQKERISRSQRDSFSFSREEL